MKWSQLKKRIEMTAAASVRGRVEVWVTRYRHAHDQEGEAWITIDQERAHSMGTWTYFREHHKLAKQMQIDRDCLDYRDPKEREDYLNTIADADRILLERGVLPAWDFTGALFDYLNMAMDDILASDHFLILAIGMLDRRLGKRRLGVIEVEGSHPLVRALYELRCSAEGLKPRPPEQRSNSA